MPARCRTDHRQGLRAVLGRRFKPQPHPSSSYCFEAWLARRSTTSEHAETAAFVSTPRLQSPPAARIEEARPGASRESIRTLTRGAKEGNSEYSARAWEYSNGAHVWTISVGPCLERSTRATSSPATMAPQKAGAEISAPLVWRYVASCISPRPIMVRTGDWAATMIADRDGAGPIIAGPREKRYAASNAASRMDFSWH